MDSDFDSDYEYEEIANIVIMRRPKVYRDRPDFFHLYDDIDFRIRFRMSKEAVTTILNFIAHQMQHKTRWNHALSPEQMILITLRFYATGGMLQTICDLFGVSKSTVSRVIRLVSHHITLLREVFIHFPMTEEEKQITRRNFYERAKFPRVIAAIDCTHVRIISPGGEDAELYRNRKGFFSINVQTLCDSKLKFLDIVARWPGSAHDTTIFKNSRVCHRLECKEFGNGLVVADSGYENSSYMVTPLSQTNSVAENLFNESLIRTRNCVERSYGVWKRRFPVLSLGLRMSLRTAQSIIVATAVLHNICSMHNDDSAPVLSTDLDQSVSNVLSVPNNRFSERVTGNNNIRRLLIDNYFENM